MFKRFLTIIIGLWGELLEFHSVYIISLYMPCLLKCSVNCPFHSSIDFTFVVCCVVKGEAAVVTGCLVHTIGYNRLADCRGWGTLKSCGSCWIIILWDYLDCVSDLNLFWVVWVLCLLIKGKVCCHEGQCIFIVIAAFI